jgi:hypothetical protein
VEPRYPGARPLTIDVELWKNDEISGRSLRATWTRHGVVVLLVVGAIVAVTLAYVVGRFANPDPATVSFEFYKLLIQALLIGAVGAFLSAAIQEDRRRREREERLRDFKRERIG